MSREITAVDMMQLLSDTIEIAGELQNLCAENEKLRRLLAMAVADLGGWKREARELLEVQ